MYRVRYMVGCVNEEELWEERYFLNLEEAQDFFEEQIFSEFYDDEGNLVREKNGEFLVEYRSPKKELIKV